MFSYLFFAIASFVIASTNAQNYCEAYQTNVQPYELPVLPDGFATRVEANFITERYTVDSVQVYDSINRKAAVQMYDRNIEFRFLFNYAQNEVYTLERFASDTEGPYYCETQNLIDAPQTAIFFGYYMPNSTYMVPGTPNDVLGFSKTGQVYNGTEIVRGIPCDVYLSCQNSETLKSSFKVKYYFSRANYSVPYLTQPFNRVPVRAELEGIYYKNNVRYPFKRIYDYHEFNPNVDGYTRTFFETPSGTFCKNRKMTKPTPKMSERYSYSEEILRFKTITNIKRIYYDSLFKLVRYDVRNTQRIPETFYVLDPLKIINDYNSGVAYYVNELLGNCSFKSLGVAPFGNDNDQNYTDQNENSGFGFSVRLKSPSSFLSLDSDYVYMGERFEGEVPIDVFITNRTDKVGDDTVNTIDEYAFRMPFTNGNGPVNTARNIPVRMSIITSDPMQSPQFNYFGFENDLPDYSAFDLSECYPQDTKINFRISFSYRDILSANDFKNSFVQFMEQFLYYVLSIELKETSMRFAPPKISIGNDGLFFAVSSILPPPPPIALFTKWDGRWLTGSDFVGADLGSAEECASFCNEQDLCMSFDYCTDIGRCFANYKHPSDNSTNISNIKSCNHYSRTAETYSRIKSMNEVWTLLQNSVALGLFRIEVPIATIQGLKTVNFTANGIIQIPGNNQFGATSILSRFDKIFTNSKYMTSKERAYTGVSADECAAACSRQESFVCESFDYCWINGECRLSRFQPTDLSDIVPFDSCEIFAKDPLYHYDMATFQVTVNSKDLKLQNVATPNDCARECDSTTKIHCRGFNYCGDSKTCYLTETHLIDETPSTSLDLVCTHYTRNYFKDFTYITSGNISTVSAEILYAETGLELCSRACVGADGFNCKSFDYCPRSRKCLLHSNNRSQVLAQSGDLGVEYCDNYAREYFYLTSTNVNVKFPSNNDNSEKTLIGLAVVFSVASIVGGFLLFIFVLPRFMK